jgi:hypothetical protein
MAEDELRAFSVSSHVPSCVINLLSLLSPYLFIWHLGLGGQTSGVWALGPKLWFWTKSDICLTDIYPNSQLVLGHTFPVLHMPKYN